MQVWELRIHWKSGLKTKGLFVSEAIARDAYRASTVGIRHTEMPPFEINAVYVSSTPENIATKLAT